MITLTNDPRDNYNAHILNELAALRLKVTPSERVTIDAAYSIVEAVGRKDRS